MYFGERSKKSLSTVTYNLYVIATEALSAGIMDFTVIEGFRPKFKQDEYYYGHPQRSKVPWPKSKHNIQPLAKAMDLVPYINGKLSWNKIHCCVLAGIVLTCAKKLGIKIRWGGNWDMDLEPVTDQEFNDLVHFEEI